MSRLSKIKEDRPDLLLDEDFAELVKSADKIHDLKATAESNGGKILIDFLINNIINTVYILSAQHQAMTQAEITSALSKLSANLATVRFLSTAKGDVDELDKQIAEQLRN